MLPLMLLLPLVGIAISFIAGIIMEAFPGLVTGLLGGLNLPGNIYSLLIEIPRPLWNEGVYGMPGLAGSVGTGATSGYSSMIGPSMTTLYAGSRNAAFALFALLLVVAAFSFFLQNFRIVAEGTATRILTGSVMALVLIYLFPAIYDVTAAAVNAVTYPAPGSIIPPDAIITILTNAATVVPSSTADIGSALAGMVMNLFLFIFVLITYASVAIMGVLRTFFIGAAFALMPVLLVMRLVPYIDKVADLFIQVIIGGFLASLIVSFFFAFGYNVLMSAEISGLMKTLIALGVLLASSLMMTVLIPHMGSLMSSISTAITGAATGAVVGGVAVATGAAVAGAQAAPGLTSAVASGAISPGRAVLSGIGNVAAGGIGTLGSVAPRMVPGMGAVGYAIPTAVSMGRGAGKMGLAQKYAADNSEYADSMLLQAAATPHEDEGSAPLMAEYAASVKADLLTRPPEVLGREYGMMTGTDLTEEEAAEIGSRMQGRVRQIMEMTKDSPEAQNILLSRIGRSYNAWKTYTMELKDPATGRPLIDVAKEAVRSRMTPEEFEKTGEAETMKELQKLLSERGMAGVSPTTQYAALRDRKANADKIADFVQLRRK